MKAGLSADGGRARADVNTPLGLALALAATGCALVSPLAGYLLALLAVYVSAHGARSLSWLAIVAFANAGAMTFASRNFIDGSVDFENYYAVFSAICAHAPPDEGLWAFGPELGLPLVYQGLAALGLCGLSMPGLAYVQGLLVSAPMLLVIERGLRAAVPKRLVPEALAGTALLFSFFYITQLSRQSLSSVFVLYALLVATSRMRIVAAVAVATLCHLTAPLIFALGWQLRRSGRVGIAVLAVVAAIAATSIDRLLSLLLGADVGALLGKLEYFNAVDRSGGVMSDTMTVVLLVAGALVVWLGRRRLPSMQRDVPMLFGFALVGAALLALPLAATRMAVAFAWLAIGGYLFAGLAALSQNAARLCLVALFTARLLSFATADPGQDHGLWRSHSPWTIPGAFLDTYLR